MGKQSNGHYFQLTTVGPNVIAYCSCQEWRMVKRKEHATVVLQAAHAHIAKYKRDHSTPADRYAKYASYMGPTDEERHQGYKNTQLLFHNDPNDGLQHGGTNKGSTPRHEKHHRMQIGGIRVK